eukprot:765764-Hanusia_phi.AAC.3
MQGGEEGESTAGEERRGEERRGEGRIGEEGSGEEGRGRERSGGEGKGGERRGAEGQSEERGELGEPKSSRESQQNVEESYNAAQHMSTVRRTLHMVRWHKRDSQIGLTICNHVGSRE